MLHSLHQWELTLVESSSGRRDAQKKYTLSTNLIQLWLMQYDREIEAAAVAAYQGQEPVGLGASAFSERTGDDGTVRVMLG